MKPDDILEAMNQIDDKWIEPVEKLRSKATIRKRINKFTSQFMKAAACIGIFVLGFWVLNLFGIIHRDATDVCDDVELESVEDEVCEGENAACSQEYVQDWESELYEGESLAEGDAGDMENSVAGYDEIYDHMSRIWSDRKREQALDREQTESAESSENSSIVNSDVSYGTTNVQVQGVEEGDILKTDGRYLYNKAYNWDGKNGIQIVDTQDGMKLKMFLAGFHNIEEFYVWENFLIVFNIGSEMGAETRRDEFTGKEIEYDASNYKVMIYDISDVSMPKLIKSFKINGSYHTSRLVDGYLYSFGAYTAYEPIRESYYDVYIPSCDGRMLTPEEIFLTQEGTSTSYMVMVSIDLRNPSEFVETKAVVSYSYQYYITNEHIYTVDWKSVEDGAGWRSGKNLLQKFSYKDGHFEWIAKGEIPGSSISSFAMDEYQDHLRVVTTVQKFKSKQLNVFGLKTMDGKIEEGKKTNALYVLDEYLNQVGCIENLAEGEDIYSARFLGDTGYFVTFYETDPLFAVDLSVPENPVILSELKLPGFSDYLHFYDENLLLGVGKEVDEKTGEISGLKLSLFDITDPCNVQEISKVVLDDYNSYDIDDDYHALLIDPVKNLIGFEAICLEYGDGYVNEYKDYFIFSIENRAIVQKLKIDTPDEYVWYNHSRGTYIGDVFYVAHRRGNIRSFDLNTGVLIEELFDEDF